MKQDELNFSYAAHKDDGSDWTENEVDELADLIIDWVHSKNGTVGGGISLRNSEIDYEEEENES